MIPIIYEKSETDFLSNGVCRLVDIIDGYVIEERNGIYECEFRYPISGEHFSDIREGRIIACWNDDTHNIQPFDIYGRSEPLNDVVTFYAHHISYRLGRICLKPFSAGSCLEAFAKFKTETINPNPFSFWTDKSVNSPFDVLTPISIKEILGGVEGSILDTYGKGEYEWDKFLVKLHVNRGIDRNVTIRYGKNLTSLKRDTDYSQTYNAVAPYWKSSDGDVLTLPEWYITPSVRVLEEWTNENDVVITNEDGRPIHFNPPYTIDKLEIVPMDLSDKFDEKPSIEQLREKTKSILDGGDSYIPKETIDVDFEQLWESEDYETYASLQRVNLCDKVDIINNKTKFLKIKMEVISAKYDFVSERYIGMTLGTPKTNFADVITASTEELISDLPNKSFMQAAIEYATKIIQGGLGGHVVFKTNADGHPEEILIMDTDNVETAVNVWRFNLGGLGHSHNGYDGPFDDVALTMDGRINANLIAAGVLNAGIIRAGLLSDKLGKNWWNLDTGEIHIDVSDFLTVGGTNLILGTRDMKENDIAYWHVSPSESIVENGTVYADGNDGSYLRVIGITGKKIKDFIGKAITFSADIYVDSLSAVGSLMMALNVSTSPKRPSPIEGYKSEYVHSQLIAGKKIRISTTFIPIASNDYFSWLSGSYNDDLYVNFMVWSNNMVGSIQLSKFKAEVGSIPTDWSPAPEDGENAVENLNYNYSRLDVTVDGINTEVGSLKANLQDNYSTTIQMNSAINQTAQSINSHVNLIETNLQDNYSTTTQMNSVIDQTAESINTEVRKKVGNDEVISKINQSAESITINADKVSLAGKEINLTSDNIQIKSNNFNVDKNGNVEAWSFNAHGGNFEFPDGYGNTMYFRKDPDPDKIAIEDEYGNQYFPIQLGGTSGFLEIGVQRGFVDLNVGDYTLRIDHNGVRIYRGNTIIQNWY